MLPVAVAPEQAACFLAPEDTILAKPERYRRRGEASERQWQDIPGIVMTQGPAFDWAYLREQARERGVCDLLERLASSRP
jgi:hypothetical protein